MSTEASPSTTSTGLNMSSLRHDLHLYHLLIKNAVCSDVRLRKYVSVQLLPRTPSPCILKIDSVRTPSRAQVPGRSTFMLLLSRGYQRSAHVRYYCISGLRGVDGGLRGFSSSSV